MTIATIMLVDDEVPFVEAMTKRLTRRDLDRWNRPSAAKRR
jgi:hypothetical protein